MVGGGGFEARRVEKWAAQHGVEGMMRDTRRSGAGEGMIGRREGGGGRWEVRWCWWEGKAVAV